MRLSAVVCTRDRPDMLAECLRSVLACDYRPRQVLVVDQSADARSHGVVAELQRRHQDLLYVPTSTRGLSAARNLAVQRADGEALAFTDDDCLADPGWLGAVAE